VSLLPDPLADLILGKIEHSMIGAWLKFLFEMAFSAVGSFLIICGFSLTLTRSWALATGNGMMSAAIAMAVLFRKETSRLTKGMLVVLPELEANKEVEADLQTIQKK
jgi:hypothetical protein